jgi:hypothetical protein
MCGGLHLLDEYFEGFLVRGVYMSMLKLTFILDPAIILAYDHNI